MQEIRELVTMYNEYTPIVFYVMIGMMVITFVVHFFTGSIKFAKYIPGLVALVFGLITLASTFSTLFEKETLNTLIASMLGIGGGIIGLCFALILGVVAKKKKYKKSSKEQVEEEEY